MDLHFHSSVVTDVFNYSVLPKIQRVIFYMNKCGLKLTRWSLKEEVLKLDYVHVYDDDDDECKTKFLGEKK
jgi:hypothetical protein